MIYQDDAVACMGSGASKGAQKGPARLRQGQSDQLAALGYSLHLVDLSISLCAKVVKST